MTLRTWQSGYSRYLSDLGDRSEGNEFWVRFFDNLRRIARLFNESYREIWPKCLFRTSPRMGVGRAMQGQLPSRFILSPTDFWSLITYHRAVDCMNKRDTFVESQWLLNRQNNIYLFTAHTLNLFTAHTLKLIITLKPETQKMKLFIVWSYRHL